MDLQEISLKLQSGKAKDVKKLVQQAIDEGYSVDEILNEGLVSGMNVIGERFKKNEIYIPEVLLAARAMNMGAALLKPLMAEAGVKAKGRVVIGTVSGDLHDIGKNLCKMMLEGRGLEVIDAGVDVAPEKFLSIAVENDCQIICCSALLTTTMGEMAEVVRLRDEAGLKGKIFIMVGGAPLTDDYAHNIGADIYTPDAASCADKALELCSRICA